MSTRAPVLPGASAPLTSAEKGLPSPSSSLSDDAPAAGMGRYNVFSQPGPITIFYAGFTMLLKGSNFVFYNVVSTDFRSVLIVSLDFLEFPFRNPTFWASPGLHCFLPGARPMLRLTLRNSRSLSVNRPAKPKHATQEFRSLSMKWPACEICLVLSCHKQPGHSGDKVITRGSYQVLQ